MAAESIVRAVTFTILAASGGFLLAVLWMDLMFDVQVLRHRGESLPEPVSTRSPRTTAASPRGLADGPPRWRRHGCGRRDQVASSGCGDEPRWAVLGVARCLVPPVVLAQTRIFPAAARLGARQGSPAEQTRLARSILRSHLLCLAAIAGFTALQLWLAA